MKKVVVICLGLLFLSACKSNENSSENDKSNRVLAPVPEYSTMRGKVMNEKGHKIPHAVIKVYLDDNDCLKVFSDANGFFEVTVDQLRVKDQSHFEVVYKGYTINMISLRNYVEEEPIVMNKKGKIVSTVEYNIFYDAVKTKCTEK